MTKRQRQILLMLAQSDGWLSRETLKASARTMDEMYWNGWVDGAGLDDKRGTGNYPWSSLWKITLKGLELADAAMPQQQQVES